ncbi:unnamed protein product [Psylliodes chrysocephalus]|uniref:Gustatory receptor n=1 Tax=Psylliodes chrysocephalus TaxID=3402493 RepID=A0A9P0D1I5_9CUCU|nr:unnamed protein product [Psylliodes chrysocephala]
MAHKDEFILRKQIEEIHDIYNKICNVCLDLNNIFGFPTLIFYIHFITSGVVEIHYSYLLKDDLNWKTALQIISVFHWTVWRASCLITIAYLYHSVLEQSKTMSNTIHNLIRKAKTPQVYKSLKLFALHEINRNLKFTVCGLFAADFTMVNTGFTTIATYVVLLIQFNVGKQEI